MYQTQLFTEVISERDIMAESNSTLGWWSQSSEDEILSVVQEENIDIDSILENNTMDFSCRSLAEWL